MERLGGYVSRMKRGLSIRLAVGRDKEFLFDLHKASIDSHVAELFGPWEDLSIFPA